MNRRAVILTGVLVALLALTALWSYGRMAEARRAATAAAEGYGECRDLAARIREIRHQPRLANGSDDLADETTDRIESAAESTGISTSRLVRITPEPPQRLGDTVYKEKPTQVLLKDVTRKQVASLIHSLVARPNGLHARSIRLSAPQKTDTSDRWSADIVLTYLIYDPPKMSE